jgi:1-acyl-sn-glycerol-3-phosphate acyltransferase
MMSDGTQRYLGYLTTPLYLTCFGLLLVLFHPIQIVAYHGFGYGAQQKVIHWLNLCLTRSLLLVGAKVDFQVRHDRIPTGSPLIFVANHQSMNDIPALIWYLRRYRLVLIGKRELSRGIPSISLNYHYGGAVSVDRKNPAQAYAALDGLAERIRNSNEAVILFPEGTRARDGAMKAFHPGGLTRLMEQLPDAVLVPVAISNSWKLLRYGFWPVPFGVHIRWQVLDALPPGGFSPRERIDRAELRIRECLGQEHGVASTIPPIA